jgi:hypothetical protein
MKMVVKDWLNLSYTLKDLDKKINQLTCQIKDKEPIRQFDAENDTEEQRKHSEVSTLNESFEQEYFSKHAGVQ